MNYNYKGYLKDLRIEFFSSDSSRQLHVSDHNRHSPGMNRTKVGILEQSDQVSFRSLLKSIDS